jgi:hypothetical protein
MRSPGYKLHEFFEDHHVELYNLKQDVGEQHDLAQSMPDKARQLLDQLHAWQKSVAAAFPTPNPDYKK